MAGQLGVTIATIEEMPVDEFWEWRAYYVLKWDDERKAIDKARSWSKSRRR